MKPAIKLATLFGVCALGAAFLACDVQAATPVKAEVSARQPTTAARSLLLFEELRSEAVHDGILQEAASRYFSVYLPPAYFDDPERRFPVVYYLHGFGGGMGFLSYFKDALDTEMRKPDVTPFIIVEADGTNSLRGSFYVNSAVTGRWEDHVVKELVAWADSTLRTIPTSQGRGIAGASMGGFGAIHLGMRHPDVYQSVLAFAPGLVAPGQIKSAWDSWNSEIKRAYGAAFSPNPALPRPHAEIPRFDGTPDDQRIIDNWERGFGAPQEKIDAYLAQAVRLKSIRIVVGKDDEYAWIVAGSQAFSRLLDAKGVEHHLELIDATHSMPTNFPVKFMVPHFSNAFSSQR
ncbi:alpha/beta hydrolase family protein [Niveibacterium umoris]|uniref:Pimeloyl-ACP methyl ester carboxylesterase n=1 Tax=Niveibacterium umoris TaxID=1193620 RepID=A0A840BH49_9RHOO|nr:alpha/beta hydrolase-fold protein [Niveibacterium umoris]MBB4011554.1 pimeloyl-ACP methyl ester carboxylesterase [Niveibacterium umoris]